ncbi:hypothetical protein MTsPCn5_17150 [Croceitalea sp. MTPC5]|uniref:Uncharacterized protein n=1 Tax=Croceitalea marina TaxID=1775166 RepID=A0ABW5MZA4_9FLAO|nr:hypothetical protein MTsPCn5_17150 [Croceitalea sp. MTPC5]
MTELDYLTKDAFLEFKKLYPQIPKTEMLKVMSKALGYKSFGHLKREFNIDSNGNFLNKKNEDYTDWPLDVSHYGFLFNEFMLMKHLKIDYKDALELKISLDNHHIFHNSNDGNINYCDLNIIEEGLEKLMNEEYFRLMADWPIRFYCRREKNCAISYRTDTKTGSFIWFDSFSLVYHKIFGDKLFLFVESLFRLFLSFDNVVFLENLHTSMMKYNKPLYKFFIKNFSYLEVETSTNRFHGKALFFNSSRNDFVPEAPIPINRFE